LAQLRLCLANLPALEAELGLSISREVLSERVRGAIRKKITKMSGMDEACHPWQTYWLIVIIEGNFGAGLAGFKGYTSEAVEALVDWALGQPVCKRVTATAVENPASRRLLEKLGARLLAENEVSSSWEFTR
jgi:hypothetical protein